MTEQIHSLMRENARHLAHSRAQGAQLRRAAQAELAQVEAKLESMAPGGVVGDAARRDEYMTLVTQRDQLRRAVA
jgi:hypothetical protein